MRDQARKMDNFLKRFQLTNFVVKEDALVSLDYVFLRDFFTYLTALIKVFNLTFYKKLIKSFEKEEQYKVKQAVKNYVEEIYNTFTTDYIDERRILGKSPSDINLVNQIQFQSNILEEKKDEIQDLKTSIDNAMVSHASLEKKISDLKNENTSLRTENERLTEIRAVNEDRMNEQHSRILDMEDKIQRLQKDLARKTQEYEDAIIAQASSERNEFQMRQLLNKNQELSRELDFSKQENEKL